MTPPPLPTEPAPPPEEREVLLCTLGGTAQCEVDDDGSARPTGDPRALVTPPSVVPAGTRVHVLPMARTPSAALDLADLIRMLEDVAPRIASGNTCGVVVSMGTDTLEEAAFALDLLWDLDAPLVLTGAMRHPARPGADGPANLRAAVQVAVDDAARGLGALVVMNDEVHAAWQVRKTHSSAPGAFRSTHSGPLGFVAEDRVRIVATPMDRPILRVPAVRALPPVALLRASMGDDAPAVLELIRRGCAGIVVEATGGGSVPPSWSRPLGAAAARVPVLYTTRTGGGAALQDSYGGPGSERDLRARGVRPAGMLDGPKARVLLRLLLVAGVPDTLVPGCVEAFDRPTHRRRRIPVVAGPGRPTPPPAPPSGDPS